MVQTYSDNDNIYSVDLMFAYINIFKPKKTKMNVSDLLHNLEYQGWGDPKKNIMYSPNDVLDNPTKYKNEMMRINDADLSFPIIVHKRYIVDGVHRLTKAKMLNKKQIDVYIFDANIMKKFLINKEGDWDAVDELETHNFIEMFYKRFCQ